MNGSRRMDLPCLITTNTLHHSCLYFLCVLRVTVEIHGSGFGMQSSSWYFMRHWLEVWLESGWGVGGKSCFRYNHYPWRELCLWLKSHYQWGVNMKSLLFCFRNLWKYQRRASAFLHCHWIFHWQTIWNMARCGTSPSSIDEQQRWLKHCVADPWHILCFSIV